MNMISRQNELVTPRTLGRDQYRTGRNLDDCPYSDWHHVLEWRNGWIDEKTASEGTHRHVFSLEIAKGKNIAIRRLVEVAAEHITQAMDIAEDRFGLNDERVMWCRYSHTKA